MTLAAYVATHPLRRPESGGHVREWQQLLVRKGFVLRVDGVFGSATEHATKVAQAWAGAAIDGIVGPETLRKVTTKRRTPRPVGVVRAVVGRPKIVDARHGQAGFPRHRSRRWGTRSKDAIVAKLGHYTGGPASFVADARFHVESNYLDQGGAPAIAYTLGVDKDGTLFVFNEWADVTWHCDGGHNTDTLGVVFRGAAEGPTLAQRKTLRWLWDHLAAGTFKPFAGEAAWPRLVRSTTHRHVNSTSCPGEKGEAFYRSISPAFVTDLGRRP